MNGSTPDLRQRAEQMLDDGKARVDDLSFENTQRLIHELQVHQVELQMQNNELRLAQIDLEIQHDRYADLFDFAPVGYMTVSEPGLIEEANLTIARWLGLDRAHLIGRQFTDFIAAEDQDIAYLHHQHIVESHEPQHAEMRLVRGDGSQFYVRLDGVLKEESPRQLPVIRSVITDITEVKQSAQALVDAHALLETRVVERTADLRLVNLGMQESEDRLHFAMEVADICYWVWNPQTDMLRWGGNCAKLFDLQPDESIESYEALIERVDTLDQAAFRQTIDSLLAGETSPQLEFRIRRPNNEMCWVLVQAQAYQSAGSGPFCVLGVMQDITIRKQSEQIRAEMLEMAQSSRDVAEQATRTKTRFLGMVSHELRTPLTSIKGFATTLLADDVEYEASLQKDMLETINEETDKLAELVEHLLNLAQLEAGALKINLVSATLQQIFAAGMADFQTLTPRHQLKLPASLDCPPVMADPIRIAQVITNLISNAVKHSPENSPISLAVRRNDAFICISVSDQGSGIAPQDREIVFQAFQQLETQSRLTSGVGLGLAICKGLIDAHQGHIWIEDQVEPGTTISFTLPIATLHQA